MCEPAGWIKMHRKMLKWEWYDDINVKTLFIHCLLKANYEDKNWRGTIVKRGSFITSLEHLSIETKLTKRQILTALDKLILTNEIKKVATNKYTMLTILNYDTYQTLDEDKCNTNVKQMENKGKSNVKQMETTKEYKEYKEIEEDKNIPEVKTSGDKKPNYIKVLYDIFAEEYKRSRGYEFETDTIKKEESAIGKLAQGFKKRNPGKTTDEAIAFFSDYFKKCLKIEHEFLKRTMSPSLILNQKTQINTIIKEGNYGNNNKPKSANSRNNSYSVEELDREVQENWDTIYEQATKHCGNNRATNVGE